MPCRCSVTIRFLALFKHVHEFHYHPRVARLFCFFLPVFCCRFAFPLIFIRDVGIRGWSSRLRGPFLWVSQPTCLSSRSNSSIRSGIPDPHPHHPHLGADSPATTSSSIQSRSGRQTILGDDLHKTREAGKARRGKVNLTSSSAIHG